MTINNALEQIQQNYSNAQKTRLNLHNQIQNSHCYNAALHQSYISSIVAELQAQSILRDTLQ